MEDIVAGVIGVSLMLIFAGGLAWLIAAPPLVIVIIGVLAMVVIDVVRSLRQEAGNGRP